MPYKDPAKAKAARRRRYARVKADPAAYEAKLAAERERYRVKAEDPEYRQQRAEQSAAWRAANPEASAQASRRHNLKRYYGITAERYEELLQAQAGHCAICGSDNGEHRLAVDHCHDTGEVRGLLCHACNQGLGKFQHEPRLLAAAQAYLQRP